METLSKIFEYFMLALPQAAILALVTFAITLIFKTSFTTNFAQGMIGAYVAYFIMRFQVVTLVKWFPNMSGLGHLVIAIIICMLFDFLIEIFIDTILIRKSRYSTVLSKQMITMGIVLVITGLLPTVYKDSFDNPASMPRLAEGNITILGVNMLKHNLYTIIISFVIILTLFLALKYTKWGLGVRSTAANERVASLMGVNTRFITAMSWGIASAIGALAATLYAANNQTLGLNLMGFNQVNGFLAAILGGFSTFHGPVIGAIIIPILSLEMRLFTTVWNNSIVYIIVMFIILVKPVGLFGKKVIKKV